MDYISREDAPMGYIKKADALVEIKLLYPAMTCVPWRKEEWWKENKKYVECEEAILRMPSADVEERKKGKWLPKQGYNNVLYCSCCTSEVMGKTHTRNFCPNCGAKMEG